MRRKKRQQVDWEAELERQRHMEELRPRVHVVLLNGQEWDSYFTVDHSRNGVLWDLTCDPQPPGIRGSTIFFPWNQVRSVTTTPRTDSSLSLYDNGAPA